MIPKVSIIIPVYNVAPYVGECIESVMAQDATIAMECIVVDDRGTDSSMDIVNRLIEDYDGPIEFRIITQEKNSGQSAARNAGVKVARGEYIYFLDSDDTIANNAISVLWKLVEAHPGVDMVVGAGKCFPTPDMDDFLNFAKYGHPKYVNRTSNISKIFLQLPEVPWNRLIHIRYIIDNNLTFKEGIIQEDLHQHLRSSGHIQSLALSDLATYNYRIRPGSTMTANSAISRHIRSLDIFADVVKHGYQHKYLLWFILFRMVKYHYLVEDGNTNPEGRKAYRSCLQTICQHLPFIKRIPFMYLLLPGAWMRLKIPNILVRLCF